MLNIISLGAGVQSSTMALMAAHGELTPMPDCAIFADTGAEPGPVYEHLKWLMSPNVLPFPVYIVQRGDLCEDLSRGVNSTGHRFASIPFHSVTPKGQDMMARRQCTSEYKISPIRKKIRELLGTKRPRPGSCEMWLGISTDEAARIAPSRVKYIINRHPLIKKRMRRWDCLQWLKRNDYSEPPKSACTFCPFRQNAEWRWLRDNDPDGFKQAVDVDNLLRSHGLSRFDSQLFIHRDRVPLAEADIRSDEERGQANLFNNECEGMCGV